MLMLADALSRRIDQPLRFVGNVTLNIMHPPDIFAMYIILLVASGGIGPVRTPGEYVHFENLEGWLSGVKYLHMSLLDNLVTRMIPFMKMFIFRWIFETTSKIEFAGLFTTIPESDSSSCSFEQWTASVNFSVKSEEPLAPYSQAREYVRITFTVLTKTMWHMARGDVLTPRWKRLAKEVIDSTGSEPLISSISGAAPDPGNNLEPLYTVVETKYTALLGILVSAPSVIFGITSVAASLSALDVVGPLLRLINTIQPGDPMLYKSVQYPRLSRIVSVLLLILLRPETSEMWNGMSLSSSFSIH
jgi:hypothetical protein